MTYKKIIYTIYRWSITPVALVIAVLLLNYWLDVQQRSGSHHWMVEESDADGGLYYAKYASVGPERIFLRIYKRGSEDILAERLYYSGDHAKFYWSKTQVGYNTTGDDWPHDGMVLLPPTRLDRLLTYLP
ncbi:hypothetical protein GN316_10280 [Xylophilus sp. Kf1]|nr:hypothetical protein [Xylophilus sp. Kf1]